MMTPYRYIPVYSSILKPGCLSTPIIWEKMHTINFTSNTPIQWDLRFLKLAKEVSNFSKDPSTKVGAVAVSQDKSIISTGYNGFSKKNKDRPEDYEDRERKLNMMLHAEDNVIIFGGRERLKRATIYTWPFPPCGTCAAKLLQCDIDRVVTIDNIPERWEFSFNLGREQFNDAGVIVDYYPTNCLD